jgi:hypothetical protein
MSIEVENKIRQIISELTGDFSERDAADWALEQLVKDRERVRAVRIISRNKGNPGAAMAEILDEGIE